MAFRQDTIKLAPALAIFKEADITEILIDEKVRGYRGAINGEVIEDSTLTGLCRKLWLAAYNS